MGRRTVNVVPWPSALSAAISPPCRAMMPQTTANPRPFP